MAKERKKSPRKITVDKSAINVFPNGPEGPRPPVPEMRKKPVSGRISARPLDPRASRPLEPRASVGSSGVSRMDFLKTAGMGGAGLLGAILGLGKPDKKKEKKKDERGD